MGLTLQVLFGNRDGPSCWVAGEGNEKHLRAGEPSWAYKTDCREPDGRGGHSKANAEHRRELLACGSLARGRQAVISGSMGAMAPCPACLTCPVTKAQRGWRGSTDPTMR